MSNFVTRLRFAAKTTDDYWQWKQEGELFREAADEIDRLRKQRDILAEALRCGPSSCESCFEEAIAALKAAGLEVEGDK